jgi:hypothetical protein
VRNALPATDLRFIMQEFGTHNPIKVLHTLREENRWHHFGSATVAHHTKLALKNVFCPESKRWRKRILARGREVAEQALKVLAQ